MSRYTKGGMEQNEQQAKAPIKMVVDATDHNFSIDLLSQKVFPFENTILRASDGVGVAATPLQFDVLFSGSDPGSYDLDATQVQRLQGPRGDLSSTGTLVTEVGDDGNLRDILGSDVQYRPFPKSSATGEQMATIMTQLGGGGVDTVMTDGDESTAVVNMDFQKFFDIGDPNLTFDEAMSEGGVDQRYDREGPYRFQRAPAAPRVAESKGNRSATGALKTPNVDKPAPFQADASTIQKSALSQPKKLREEVQSVRSQQLVTNSPFSKQPTPPPNRRLDMAGGTGAGRPKRARKPVNRLIDQDSI